MTLVLPGNKSLPEPLLTNTREAATVASLGHKELIHDFDWWPRINNNGIGQKDLNNFHHDLQMKIS